MISNLNYNNISSNVGNSFYFTNNYNLKEPNVLFSSSNITYNQDKINFNNNYNFNYIEKKTSFWESVSLKLNNIYNGIKSFLGFNNSKSLDTSIFFSSNSVSSLIENIFSKSTSKIITMPYKDNSGKYIKLAPEAAIAFEKLMRITSQKGIIVSVSSSYRSVEQQRQLYSNAIKKYGSESVASKWVAPPGRSMHNYGYAIDLAMYKNGKKLSQSEFDKIISEAGFYRPMDYEGWHIEPLYTKGKRKQIANNDIVD